MFKMTDLAIGTPQEPCRFEFPFAHSVEKEVCKFQMPTSSSPIVFRAFLGCQLEKAVHELNLSKKIISCHPSNLPLQDHVDRFVALNRSPSRLEFSEALLRIHSTRLMAR